MSEPPTRANVRGALERVRVEFADLVERADPEGLARRSNGTRWTNRELLFHMLFGHLVTRALRYLFKVITHAPRPVQNAFAATLNAATRPFHLINYWGSRFGGRTLSPLRMARWSDRVIASLQRHLDAEPESSLRGSMAFPTRWDPYFAARMTLLDLYRYTTLHFDHHRRQLTLDHP